MGSLRRSVALVVVLGAAAVLTGCTKTIKESDVESKITTNLAGQMTGTKIEVDCPGGKEAKKGETFTCAAKIGGRDAAVAVRLLDDEGRFSFSVRSQGQAP